MVSVVFSLVLAFGDPVGPVPSDVAGEEAETLIKSGLDLRRAGEDKKALTFFEEAYRLFPSPRARAQLGFAEQAIGLWLKAEVDLEGAASGSQDPWVRKNKAAIGEALRTIGEHLATLTVTGSPDGATVYLEGERAGTLPFEGRVLVGENVEITVKADGYEPRSRTIKVKSGSPVAEAIALRKLPARALATSRLAPVVVPLLPAGQLGVVQVEERKPAWKRPWIWAAAGGLIAVVAVTLALTAGRQDTYPTPSLGSHAY